MTEAFNAIPLNFSRGESNGGQKAAVEEETEKQKNSTVTD